jgi:O-antigen ligase
MSFYQEFISAERAYILISFIMVLFGLVMHFRLGSSQLSLSELHTNQYSAIAAMGFVYCFGERYQSDMVRKKTLTRLALLFGFLTALGTSATSNVAALTGILVVLTLVRRAKGEIVLFLSAGLIALYWSGYFEEFWMDVLFPGKSEYEIISLKGRAHLWDMYLGLIAEQPILGYGFVAISRMGHMWGNISTTNTHNGFLEVLLSTGLLGGSFFLIWLLGISKEMLHAYKCNRIGAVGAIGAFTVALINNLGRTIMGGSFDAPSTVFVILIALFACHIRVQAPTHVPAKERVPVHQRRKGFLNVKPRALSRTIGKPR